MVRQRQLYKKARTRRIGVELPYHRLDLGLACVTWEFAADTRDADLGAVAMLAGDVDTAARIITDQDRPQAGGGAQRGQAGDPILQLAAYGGGRPPTAANSGAHRQPAIPTGAF